MSTQNVNVARFALNFEWDFFCNFQTSCISQNQEPVNLRHFRGYFQKKKIKIDLILVWFLSDFLHHLHICLLCWSNKEVSSKQKRSSKLSSKESEPYATVVNCTSKLLNFHLVKYVGKSIMCRKSCLWLHKANDKRVSLMPCQLTSWSWLQTLFCPLLPSMDRTKKKSTLSQWKVTW